MAKVKFLLQLSECPMRAGQMLPVHSCFGTICSQWRVLTHCFHRDLSSTYWIAGTVAEAVAFAANTQSPKRKLPVRLEQSDNTQVVWERVLWGQEAQSTGWCSELGAPQRVS